MEGVDIIRSSAAALRLAVRTYAQRHAPCFGWPLHRHGSSWRRRRAECCSCSATALSCRADQRGNDDKASDIWAKVGPGKKKKRAQQRFSIRLARALIYDGEQSKQQQVLHLLFAEVRCLPCYKTKRDTQRALCRPISSS